MTGSPLNRKLKNFVIANSSDWLEQAPAVLGDLDGNVATGVNGMVYARFTNGQVIQAFNRIAPLVFDLQIIVGRSKTLSNTWQVILVRENYLSPAAGGAVSAHHDQHEFPNQDTVWVNRKQVTSLTVLVSDSLLFKVQVYGALVRTKNGIVAIENQEIDLSSYVPASGAVYVAIETDEAGTLTINEGTPFLSPEAAVLSDVPAPAAGKYTIGFVMLHDVMTELTNEMIGLPVPLVTDYDGILINPVEYIDFDLTGTANPEVDGRLSWNPDEGTLNLGMLHGVIQQVGQELFYDVINQTGSTITDGTPVMFAGTLGASGHILIQKGIADGSLAPEYTMGLITHEILNGDPGKVTAFGKVRGIDTTGSVYGQTWADGDLLWLSQATAGYLTNVEPTRGIKILMAAVIKAHANGTLLVRPTWNAIPLRSRIFQLMGA